MLMGKTPADYDITTSATPEEIKAVFAKEKTVDTGIKHGTVSLILRGVQYEITTYRTDGEYLDARHPESVSFSRSIEDDLSRRDFTVNAMCYNLNLGVTDLHGGREDLSAGVIRAVGDPKKRFSEDALRILRALRFAATIGFDIEENTAAALREKSENLALISKERIQTELKKLISGDYSHKILMSFPEVFLKIIPGVTSLDLPKYDAFLALTPTERLCAVFALNSSKEALKSALPILRWDKATVAKAYDILSATEEISAEEKKIKELMLRVSKEILSSAAAVAKALERISAEEREYIESLNNSDTPRSISQLNVTGEDLKGLGLCGKALGDMLNTLIYEVCVVGLENEKNVLLSFAASKLK
jgi:tRNA nucleotidyltransferase (CCA-adding enzyme)